MHTSHLCYLPQFAFCCHNKTLTKTNVGGQRRIYLSLHWEKAKQELKAGNLETETEAETMEECFLLAHTYQLPPTKGWHCPQ